MIKIKSRLGRFVACVVSAGAILAVFVALGVSFLSGNGDENAVPPCEFIAHDGTTLYLTREEANTASPSYNANGIAQEASPTTSVAITCNP